MKRWQRWKPIKKCVHGHAKRVCRTFFSEETPPGSRGSPVFTQGTRLCESPPLPLPPTCPTTCARSWMGQKPQCPRRRSCTRRRTPAWQARSIWCAVGSISPALPRLVTRFSPVPAAGIICSQSEGRPCAISPPALRAFRPQFRLLSILLLPAPQRPPALPHRVPCTLDERTAPGGDARSAGRERGGD